MTRHTAAACVAVGVILLGAWHVRGAPQEQDPRPANHVLLMENALVRVFEIRMAPGMAEARHRHERGLTIALSDYENETTAYPSGQVSRSRTGFGEVRWAEPVVHEARNVGTTPQHVIRIELK
jgi:hypothetical protein